MSVAESPTDIVYIRSTLDPRTRTPACLVTWGLAVQTLITPEVAFTTARDLMAAAAHAEADVAFLRYCHDKLKVDLQTAGYMLRDIRASRPAPAGDSALRISALAGILTGTPRALVHIARGSAKGELTPDEAREMALHWTETAAAALVDARFRHALHAWDRGLTPADIEQLFGLVAEQQ